MHIIGGHDYYDCMINVVGIDKTIKFVRTAKQLSREDVRDAMDYYKTKQDKWIPFEPWVYDHLGSFTLRGHRHQWPTSVQICPFQVYFCGKEYVGYRVYITGLPVFITYSFKKLKEHVSPYIENDLKPGRDLPDQIIRLYDPKTYAYFIKHKIVLATNDPNDFNARMPVTINGCNLGQLKFMTVMDPFSAHQAIEAWITNDLANQVDGPDIVDDKIKIQKHGFDLKTSFRHPVKLKA